MIEYQVNVKKNVCLQLQALEILHRSVCAKSERPYFQRTYTLVHWSVWPTLTTYLSTHPIVCLCIRPDRFLAISRKTHKRNILRFSLLMYHVQNWLHSSFLDNAFDDWPPIWHADVYGHQPDVQATSPVSSWASGGIGQQCCVGIS